MNKLNLLLLLLTGYSLAQTPSHITINQLNRSPYQVGDTIRLCSICSQDAPSDSVFISTNLFSSPLKPSPVISSGSKSIIINYPDTTWKYFFTLNSDHCDTISFIAYYAPFDIDSLFFIKFKMSDFEIANFKFKFDSNSLEVINLKMVRKTIQKQSLGHFYINLLGRKCEIQGNCYMLTKKRTAENIEIILSKGLQ